MIGRGDQALQLILISVIVIATVVGFMFAGPEVEARLFPVLQVGSTSDDVGGRLFFEIHGRKFRACDLLAVSYQWRVNHALMPTAITDADSQAVEPASLPKGKIQIGPYYALVPTAARLAPDAAFFVTFFYRCNPLWVTTQQVLVGVTLGPPLAGN